MSSFLNRREFSLVFVTVLIGFVLIPSLNAFTKEQHWLHISTFSLSLYGKYLTYAVLALGVNLLWGYTGILSLGQSLFFSLGGYCIGMHMMMNLGWLGQYHEAIPDFMVFLEFPNRFPETGGFPPHWIPFKNISFTVLMVFLIPGFVAGVFGYLAFRSRIKGVYFSILSQALTYAACLMFFRNDFTFGGNNGLTDFKYLIGNPSLIVADISEPILFGKSLNSGDGELSKFIFSQLQLTNQQNLVVALGQTNSLRVASILCESLNRIIATSAIYKEERFTKSSLTPDLKSEILLEPRDSRLLMLNRRLLEVAFPRYIIKSRFLGLRLNDPAIKRYLFVCSFFLLLMTYLFCKWLTKSRFGLVQRAVRDSESRVLYSGYATSDFKLVVFIAAAVISGLGGALFVPQVGIINPSEMGADRSIEAVIWVAVGGRGNLLGPILGAIGVNALKSYCTHVFPEQWPYILGGLFIFVTIVMPNGLIGLPAQLIYCKSFLLKKYLELRESSGFKANR